MKRLIFLSIASLGLFGCSGDNSSSGNSDTTEGIQLVESLASMKYDAKDSAMTITHPVCRVDAKGDLLWEEQGTTAASKLILAIKGFDASKNTARFVALGEEDSETFRYEGSDFPYGLWIESGTESDNFYDAISFDKNDGFKEIEIYQGDCVAKDMMAEFKDDLDDEFAFLEDMEYKNCSELTFLGGKGIIKVRDLNSEGMDLTLAYEEASCDFSIKQRYAIYEEDCKAAYEEYLVDVENSDEEFEFDDYSEAFEGDEECLVELVTKIFVSEMI